MFIHINNALNLTDHLIKLGIERVQACTR